jgi:hypothetical protein
VVVVVVFGDGGGDGGGGSGLRMRLQIGTIFRVRVYNDELVRSQSCYFINSSRFSPVFLDLRTNSELVLKFHVCFKFAPSNAIEKFRLYSKLVPSFKRICSRESNWHSLGTFGAKTSLPPT